MKEWFQHQIAEWSRPPISGRNEETSAVLDMTDDALRRWIGLAAERTVDQAHYFKDMYKAAFGFDGTSRRRVLDFGCGHGLDALFYARAGNIVSLADINATNIAAAARVLEVHGYEAREKILITGEAPFFECEPVDVFHASGVLHHIPWWREILARACEISGEIRALLYTDAAWNGCTGNAPQEEFNIMRHDRPFMTFVRKMDAVGFYAEPFNQEKLEQTGLVRVKSWTPIRGDGWYAVAIMEPL